MVPGSAVAGTGVCQVVASHPGPPLVHTLAQLSGNPTTRQRPALSVQSISLKVERIAALWQAPACWCAVCSQQGVLGSSAYLVSDDPDLECLWMRKFICDLKIWGFQTKSLGSKNNATNKSVRVIHHYRPSGSGLTH